MKTVEWKHTYREYKQVTELVFSLHGAQDTKEKYKIFKKKTTDFLFGK